MRRNRLIGLASGAVLTLSLAATVVVALAAGTAMFIFISAGPIASKAAADEVAALEPPYARTGAAFGVTARSAAFFGFVNARGSTTTAKFQYGLTKTYGRWTPIGEPEHFYVGFHRSSLEAGTGGLRPATTYHFRLVATNEGGTTYGKDKTFRTLPR